MMLKAPIYSLLNSQSVKMIDLLRIYGNSEHFNSFNFSQKRLTLNMRRMAVLVLARYLLFKLEILSFEQAKTVEIYRLPSGYPYLIFPEDRTFNLPMISISHSGAWIACLLSSSQAPACIDIEDITITRPSKELADYAFFEKEKQFVAQNGKIGFFRLWTAKEAIAKCQRKGLSQALSLDFDSQLEPSATTVPSRVYIEGETYLLSQYLTDENIFYTVAKVDV